MSGIGIIQEGEGRIDVNMLVIRLTTIKRLNIFNFRYFEKLVNFNIFKHMQQ